MNTPSKLPWLVAAALTAGVVVGAFLTRPVLGVAQEKAQPGYPRYSVVSTEGTNLIVTDNQTSKLHFYTVDQGKEAGADLTLRGTVDLTQVGKEVLKPTLYKDAPRPKR